MKTENRQVSFELLRIAAMLMVVTLHYLNHTGLLPIADAGRGIGGIHGVMALFLESFCIVAVNVYVMISGYFLSVSGFRIRRLLQLMAEIYFYSLLIPVFLMAVGVETGWQKEGLYGLLPWIFPLQTEHYWFATSYIILYLLSPLLNAACRTLRKETFGMILLLLLLWFSISKSILPVEMVTDQSGYDFGWFVCVYLTGAWLRCYGHSWIQKGGRAWAWYVGCSLLTFVLGLGACLIYERTGSMAYLTALPFHYNFILCYLGATALFLAVAGRGAKDRTASAVRDGNDQTAEGEADPALSGNMEIRREPGLSGGRKPSGRRSSSKEMTGRTDIQGSEEIRRGKTAAWICRISRLTFGVYLMHEHLLVRHQWTGWIQEITGPVAGLPAALLIPHWLLSAGVVFGAGCLAGACREWLFGLAGRMLVNTKLYGWLEALDRQL